MYDLYQDVTGVRPRGVRVVVEVPLHERSDPSNRRPGLLNLLGYEGNGMLDLVQLKGEYLEKVFDYLQVGLALLLRTFALFLHGRRLG
jgi:hypothetical protein